LIAFYACDIICSGQVLTLEHGTAATLYRDSLTAVPSRRATSISALTPLSPLCQWSQLLRPNFENYPRCPEYPPDAWPDAGGHAIVHPFSLKGILNTSLGISINDFVHTTTTPLPAVCSLALTGLADNLEHNSYFTTVPVGDSDKVTAVLQVAHESQSSKPKEGKKHNS
jgi:hypothetical protein